MDELNKKFFDCLINFDTFSRIPPNTDIHLSKNGYFTPTAGKLSGIIGAQTIANMYNGYKPENLTDDLVEFINYVINIMEQMIEISIDDEKFETACKIKILYRNVNDGYGNDDHGLHCLLQIYKNTCHYNPMIDAIYNLRDYVNKIKCHTKSWLKCDKILPECNFTNEEWEYYLLNCTKLQYETVGFYKYYIQYTSSLMFNQLMNYTCVWNWYDMIYENEYGTKIYLGGMPLKSNYSLENRNDLLKIKELNIKSVLSVVEVFENQTTGIVNTPINPEEWGNIKFLQIPIPDFIEMSLDRVRICVEYINWNIKNKRSIYISCRVGRQRSSFVLMCYLVKYLKFSVEEVYDYIKSKRGQVQNKHIKLLKQYALNI